jgi:cytochrome c biogenesis protein
LFENTKCECGHQNPPDTTLCESCGKPLGAEAQSEGPLEMRYEGAARRSRKANPNVLDRIWSFFSSVKVAVVLIVITLIAATLGTILPQESSFINFDPAWYEENYGLAGKIYYMLGLSHTYESWWFITLLVMIGASLVICSLDRVVPLYRALNRQQARKHIQFLTRQRVTYAADLEGDAEEWTRKLAESLRKKRFRVTTEETALLAEKNRFSRWGPYINHVGLIIFLLAVLARAIPGWHMDEYVGVREGEVVPIPETNYYVKNIEFNVEYYPDDELPERLKGTLRPKRFVTKAELYVCEANCGSTALEPVLRKVKEHDILVNDPLEYRGLKLYQFDYDTTPRLKAVHPVLVDLKSGETYGPFELSILEPEPEYELGPYRLKLITRFLDFTVTESGEPGNKSSQPNAPAFLFLIEGPDLPEGGETFFYFPIPTDRERFGQDLINGEMAERFDFRVTDMAHVEFLGDVSYLNVRVDRALPLIFAGAFISLIGLVMGFYWQHRRVWLRIEGGRLTLGAHTNKNWYGLRSEVAAVLRAAGLEADPKSLDNGGKRQ